MTAAPKRKSLPRRITSTILWTLALLLLTNVFWSVWAAFNYDRRWDSSVDRLDLGSYEYPGGRFILADKFTSATITLHNVELGTFEEFKSRGLEDMLSGYPGDRERLLPRWLQTRLSSQELRPYLAESLCSVGWPIRVLWSGFADTGSGWHCIPFTSIPESDFQPRTPSLPIRPIWTGQTFYAAFWLGVLLIVPFTRRRFRAWRGRCVNCNYDLRANTTGVCPECGAESNTANQ